MAWTKAKTAIVGGLTITLAAGTTTLVTNRVAANRVMTVSTSALSTNNLSWADDPKYWRLALGDRDPQKSDKTYVSRTAAFTRSIESLPPVLILRPTRFNTDLGGMGINDKFIGRGRSLAELIRYAYDTGYINRTELIRFASELTNRANLPSDSPGRNLKPPTLPPRPRLILPSDFPAEKFDLMLTLPDNPREALQEEIKKRFGLVAHLETIETNVLFLKVKSSDAPGLKATKGGKPSYTTQSPIHKITIKNEQLWGVAACFGAQLNALVINQTEITNHYDIDLRWYVQAGESAEEAFKRKVLEQLGLEFVPSRQPILYLIVEKIQ